MAWFWGRKTKDLYEFVMREADNPSAWGFSECRAIHLKSDTHFWIANLPANFDVVNDSCRNMSIGFSMVQKWKLHRKLNKLKQKLERDKRARDTTAQDLLEKMVGDVWSSK